MKRPVAMRPGVFVSACKEPAVRCLTEIFNLIVLQHALLAFVSVRCSNAASPARPTFQTMGVFMYPSPTKVAFATALFLAAAPALALAYDSPAQMEHDQTVCNERFAGQDVNKTRQEREDCVHRERVDRKDRTDRAELEAKDRADREHLR
jgi:hypothetical protein